jgi:hypothetical protein
MLEIWPGGFAAKHPTDSDGDTPVFAAAATNSSATMGTKRKQSENSYTPSFGLVTAHQVRLAMEEYDRLEREEKEHGRILVAQRVPLERWRKSKIPSSMGQVVIEADFEDIDVTKKTKADLFIAKLPGLAHDCGLGDLTFQLGGLQGSEREPFFNWRWEYPSSRQRSLS